MGALNRVKQLINYQKKPNKSTAKHAEEIRTQVAGMHTQNGDYWIGKKVMEQVVLLDDPKITLAGYKALNDKEKKPLQDQDDNFLAVRLPVRNSFKNYLANDYAKNLDDKVYGVGLHDMVVLIILQRILKRMIVVKNQGRKNLQMILLKNQTRMKRLLRCISITALNKTSLRKRLKPQNCSAYYRQIRWIQRNYAVYSWRR